MFLWNYDFGAVRRENDSGFKILSKKTGPSILLIVGSDNMWDPSIMIIPRGSNGKLAATDCKITDI